jgi:hypothetical protein
LIVLCALTGAINKKSIYFICPRTLLTGSLFNAFSETSLRRGFDFGEFAQNYPGTLK